MQEGVSKSSRNVKFKKYWKKNDSKVLPRKLLTFCQNDFRLKQQPNGFANAWQASILSGNSIA